MNDDIGLELFQKVIKNIKGKSSFGFDGITFEEQIQREIILITKIKIL